MKTPKENYRAGKAVYATLAGAAATGMLLGNELYDMAPRLEPVAGIALMAYGLRLLLRKRNVNEARAGAGLEQRVRSE